MSRQPKTPSVYYCEVCGTEIIDTRYRTACPRPSCRRERNRRRVAEMHEKRRLERPTKPRNKRVIKPFPAKPGKPGERLLILRRAYEQASTERRAEMRQWNPECNKF